jgi:hypothetical protein
MRYMHQHPTAIHTLDSLAQALNCSSSVIKWMVYDKYPDCFTRNELNRRQILLSGKYPHDMPQFSLEPFEHEVKDSKQLRASQLNKHRYSGTPFTRETIDELNRLITTENPKGPASDEWWALFNAVQQMHIALRLIRSSSPQTMAEKLVDRPTELPLISSVLTWLEDRKAK